MQTPRPLQLVDGWLTDDPDELRHYQSGARWSYLQQLRMDLRAWKPCAGWLVSFGCISEGALTGNVMWTGLGLSFLAVYARMFVMVVRGRSRAVPLTARISFDGRHPFAPDFVKGSFTELGGARTGQAFLPAWAADATARPDGTHEVLIAYDPHAQYSQIIGVRPPATG
jgi:hypothetical protein